MPKKKTREKVVGDAFDSISKPKINIDEINQAIRSKNSNELVDFVIRFSATKDCATMLQLLAAIQENPQQLCGDNEFETVRMSANIDGERNLVRKFATLVSYALDQDRLAVENVLNPKAFL